MGASSFPFVIGNKYFEYLYLCASLVQHSPNFRSTLPSSTKEQGRSLLKFPVILKTINSTVILLGYSKTFMIISKFQLLHL